MKKLRRILVAVADLHHVPGGALRRAAELARATGARVELFHAVTEPLTLARASRGGPTLLQLTPEDSVARAQKSLVRLERSKLLAGCSVKAVTIWDRPVHEAIVRRAVAARADLIISGTRSRSLTNRLLLRHTDWELVRHAPVPLLLVKSARRARKAVVLAAIDPLHANAKPARLDSRILDMAGGMTAALKGTLHAFHAYVPLTVSLAAGFGEPIVWDSTAAEREHTALVVKEFTRCLRNSPIPPARRHLRLGDPASELAYLAQKLRATLVVMGAVSRSRLGQLFIGSTAERVLDEIGCDVLIIKPHDAKSPVSRSA
jgi:universal stress protein E